MSTRPVTGTNPARKVGHNPRIKSQPPIPNSQGVCRRRSMGLEVGSWELGVERSEMPKGYWVVLYRSVSDTARLAEYASRAVPAITGGGGRFIARGSAVHAYEAGIVQRSVIIEFDSVAAADATY